MKERGKLRNVIDGVAAGSVLAISLAGPAAAVTEKPKEASGISNMAEPQAHIKKATDKPSLDDVIKQIQTPERHKVKNEEGFANVANKLVQKTPRVEKTLQEKVREMHLVIGEQPSIENPQALDQKIIWVSSEAKRQVTHALATQKLSSSTPQEVVKVKKALEGLTEQAVIDAQHDKAVDAQFDKLIDKAEKPGKIRKWLKKFLPKAGIVVAAEEKMPQQQDQQEKKHPSPTPTESISSTPSSPESSHTDDLTPTLVLGGVAVSLLGGAGLFALYRRRAENRLQRFDLPQPVDIVIFPVPATQEEVDDRLRSSLKESLSEDYAYAMNIWNLVQKDRNKGNSEDTNNINLSENDAQIFLTLITKARDDRYKPSFGERQLIKGIRHYFERHRHREDDPTLGRKVGKYLNKHAQEA